MIKINCVKILTKNAFLKRKKNKLRYYENNYFSL